MMQMVKEFLNWKTNSLKWMVGMLSLMLQVFFVAHGLCVGVANLSDPVWQPRCICLAVIAAFLFGVTMWSAQLCRAFRIE